MKLKEGFVLRKMPDMNIVVPSGENIRTYRNAIILNDTAAFIYEAIGNGNDVTESLMKEYGIDEARAASAAERTIADFREAGLIED